MKKIIYIIGIMTILISCEKPWTCENKSRPKIETEFSVLPFGKITTLDNVELVIKEGKEQKVVLKSTKKSLETATVEVVDSTLIIKQKDRCVSAKIKAYVTAPNITEIRNASLLSISSDGVLHYPNLTLYSENYIMPKVLCIGDFKLKVDCKTLVVASNYVSSFYISGKTENLSLFFYQMSRFEGAELMANNLFVSHAGSNDIIVHPKNHIVGDLYGTGNLICLGKPKVSEVKCHYIGKVIYK